MNTSLAITSWAVAGMLIGNLVVMADRSQRETEKETETEHQPVANEVANGVVNNTAITTETEVYRVVCTSEVETFCKEYSVRRITKE